MDGGDFRAVDAQKLMADVLVARITHVRAAHALREGCHDLCTQLRSRRLGVGDDEKRVDVLPFLADLFHNAVHEDFRLAGTSSRRNEQIAAAVIDDSFLLLCELDSCHGKLSLAFSLMVLLYHYRNNSANGER